MLSNSSPNLLILTDNEEKFLDIKFFLKSILGMNSYTIYRLTTDDVFRRLWIQNCQLLIQVGEFQECNFIMLEFLQHSGKILTFSLNDQPVNIEDVYQNEMQLEKEFVNEKTFLYNVSTGFHFISRSLPYNENLNELKELLVNKIGLIQINEAETLTNLEPDAFQIFTQNESSISIVKLHFNTSDSNVNFTEDLVFFDDRLYFENLQTNRFGKILLYTLLTGSTMNTFRSLPESIENLVVVARQQSSGVGNNNNEWLSPIGCCMFTVFMNLNANEIPLPRLSLLQLVAGLSCVKAIRTESEYQNLDFGIKWPNDIYYNKKTKIGGILVQSSVMGEQVFVKIGVGLNLDNSHPTECLNKIFRENNLNDWKCEMFIAKFLNHFDKYYQTLKSEVMNEFMNDFQQNWLHTNQKVRLESLNQQEAEIIGINEFGYLKVKTNDNTEHILQPDGNRFDFMQNLIVRR